MMSTMTPHNKKQPLVVICGPTASGKTALSIALCQAFDGEVISADSMQIYREMDIATAKPTLQERAGVPHHLMDILEPGESFSVAQYTQLATKAIQEVAQRGHLPFVVGGTGLYIHSLVDHIQFQEQEQSPQIREKWLEYAQKNGNEALHACLEQVDPLLAQRLHPNNVGRVIRALEVYETTGKTMSQVQAESRQEESPYDLLMIGLTYQDREHLYHRINLRVDQMLQDGLLEEAQAIQRRNLSHTAAQAIGYKELAAYQQGKMDLEQALEQIKQASRRYAKRQLTWFRRDPRIHWLYPDSCSPQELLEQATDLVRTWKKELPGRIKE